MGDGLGGPSYEYMFTGIIEELGTINLLERSNDGARIVISANLVTSDISNGDSIAVNGVCLTATDVTKDSFCADVSPETLHRTTINDLRTGSPVNLERAMLPTTRFGGHIVQGHVDGIGTFLSADKQGDFYTVKIGFPPELERYLVHKGSIAVEGISLTIAALDKTSFDIAVIPKTWEMTNLSCLTPDSSVNLETDIIAKYVERMMTLK
ncbi:MAG: riboflavin synthase [Pyrinomonadaceae bacterium]